MATQAETTPFRAGRLYSDQDWCEFTGIDRRTWRRLRAGGRIAFLKIGKSIRYRGEDLLAFLAQTRRGGAA